MGVLCHDAGDAGRRRAADAGVSAPGHAGQPLYDRLYPERVVPVGHYRRGELWTGPAGAAAYSAADAPAARPAPPPGNGEAIWGAGADKLRGGISHQPYRLGDQRGHQRAAGTAGGRAPAGYGDGHQPMDHIPFWGAAGAGGGGMDLSQADPAAAFPLGRAGGDLRLGVPVWVVPRQLWAVFLCLRGGGGLCLCGAAHRGHPLYGGAALPGESAGYDGGAGGGG